MGWAKYTEDNNEISIERWYMRKSTMPYILKSEDKRELFQPSEIKDCTDNAERFKRVIPKHHNKVVCCDCGCIFDFGIQAQKYFIERGWRAPKRCKRCRDFHTAKFLMCSAS